MRRISQHEDGFTMVELMVTIVIIATLVAIAIPIFNNQRKKADLSTVKEDVQNTSILVEQEKARKGTYVTTLPSQYGGKILGSDGVVLSVKLLSARNPATACIQGYHKKHTATADRSYYILSEKKLKSGICPTS